MSPANPSRVEFLIPYLGDPTHLEVAVRSVLDQTDPAWLLTVVQDGPGATSRVAWVNDLDDDRVTYVTNPDNLGVPANFQRCLALAKGSHVVFLGCDDALLPEYVATVRRALASSPGIDVLQPGVEVMDNAGRAVYPLGDRVKGRLRPRNSHTLSGERLLVTLLRGNWTYFPALCWRRAAIAQHGFRQDLPITLDLALLSQVILGDGTLMMLDEPLFRYRRHPRSASSLAALSVDRFEEEHRLFGEIEAACRGRGWTRAARAARWHLTSRLHAAAMLPRAAFSSSGSVHRLLVHVVRP